MPINNPLLPEPQRSADEFLSHELTRIRDLPELAPGPSGESVELFWALVVGTSKTTGANVPQSIALVRDFLVRDATDIQLPSSVNYGPDRVRTVQKMLTAYTPDPAFMPDYSNVSTSRLWPARKALIGVSVVLILGLLFNHYEAVHDHNVSLYGVFLIPLVVPLFLAGAVDPRIVWALGTNGHLMPQKYRTMGMWAALAGAGLAVCLAFYYGIW